MRISVAQDAAQTPLQQPVQLSAQERAQLYRSVTGTTERASDEPAPNREFNDLWLRFIASVAQFGRHDLVASTAPGVTPESVRLATREMAAVAAPRVHSALAMRDQWQVIDQASAAELGGARNAARHRTLAEAGGTILEWLARHADGATPDATDKDLLNAAEQWLAVTGTSDAATHAYSQPQEASQRVVAWSRALHEAVGVGDRAAAAVPKAPALFSGASGTARTLAAQWLATSLGVDLFRIDLSSVVSRYIGETEKNLEKLFGEAQRSQSVLLFDEADALFGKRTKAKDSHDRYANIDVNYLLQRLESYSGIAILATNSKQEIDPDVLERMRVVAFPISVR
ncbi:MAG TPA: ATP-binding protein [Burkholderiaceae bacterium]|nr:ATP-binding protein [Burkholderiaceae bacterium]